MNGVHNLGKECVIILHNVNHGELDDAEILVRGLSDKLREGNTEELTEDLYEIQYHFAHLTNSEKPKFQNVF